MKLKSRYQGITYNDSVNGVEKPWKAEINLHGKGGVKFLGVFATEEEAIKKWNDVARGHGKETQLIREVVYLKEGEEYV